MQSALVTFGLYRANHRRRASDEALCACVLGPVSVFQLGRGGKIE